MTPLRIDISIVTYKTDLLYLKIVLISLCRAIQHARANVERELVFSLFLVENAVTQPAPEPELLIREARLRTFDAVHHIASPTNVGFGRGHNLAILATHDAAADYHLVLNPDVEIATDALTRCLEYLETSPDVVAIIPNAVDRTDAPCYLAKGQPSVVVLFFRAYLPRTSLALLRERLDRYELRPASDGEEPVQGVLHASGCFLFARASALRAVGGFSPEYFLYFEDFDLSNRLRRIGRLDYLPQVRLIHHGGNVGRKGLRHLLLFSRSAVRFFNRWGWKFW